MKHEDNKLIFTIYEGTFKILNIQIIHTCTTVHVPHVYVYSCTSIPKVQNMSVKILKPPLQHCIVAPQQWTLQHTTPLHQSRKKMYFIATMVLIINFLSVVVRFRFVNSIRIGFPTVWCCSMALGTACLANVLNINAPTSYDFPGV